MPKFKITIKFKDDIKSPWETDVEEIEAKTSIQATLEASKLYDFAYQYRIDNVVEIKDNSHN